MTVYVDNFQFLIAICKTLEMVKDSLK